MNQTSNLITSFQIQDYISNQIISEFAKSPFLNTFVLNLEYLLQNSDLVLFDKDVWRRRPEVYALHQYNNHNLYLVVLLVNNLGSRFQFLPENMVNSNLIITPKQDSIISLLNNTISV